MNNLNNILAKLNPILGAALVAFQIYEYYQKYQEAQKSKI